MNEQTIINTVLGLLSFLGGYVLNSLKDSIKDLDKSCADLGVKVQAIEVLVAGAYVKKDEFEKLAIRIFQKLDSIEDKLDKKADKADCPVKHA